MRDVRCDKKRNTYFHNAIRKYGFEAFTFEEIDTATTLEELNSKEAMWIDYYKSNNKLNGYNLDSGGKNCTKSKSTKRLLSSKSHEIWKDPDRANRMRNGLKKGTSVWQEKCRNSLVPFRCPICGKTILFRPYEAKRRKYCSVACAQKGENGAKGIRAATEVNEKRFATKHTNMRLDIIIWALHHKDIVMNCPRNRISTTLSDLSESIEIKYGVIDFRTMSQCFLAHNKKEFLTCLQQVISNNH